MAEVTLEYVAHLAMQLPPEDLRRLIDCLEKRWASGVATSSKQPRSLRGIWQGRGDENFDLEAALQEIRQEWQQELEEFSQ